MILRSMLRVAAATAVFGLVHSALATRRAKLLAAQTFGVQQRNGLYRAAFIVQSVGATALLVAYIRRQPSRELYRAEGLPALVLRLGQAAALVYATAAARQVGLGRITGVESCTAWLNGQPAPPEPEAQGPALDSSGRERAAGPFAWSRHPLNFAPLPIFWLQPRMTTNLLAFNAAATVYLVLGSLHEEARLLEEYGDEYARYQETGVSFCLPIPVRNSSDSVTALTDDAGTGRTPRLTPTETADDEPRSPMKRESDESP